MMKDRRRDQEAPVGAGTPALSLKLQDTRAIHVATAKC